MAGRRGDEACCVEGDPSSLTGEGCPPPPLERSSSALGRPPGCRVPPEPTRRRQLDRWNTFGLVGEVGEVDMEGRPPACDPVSKLSPSSSIAEAGALPFSHVGLIGGGAPAALALVIPTPYALSALMPLVTIRGTAGVRCGLRIGTAWTDEVERVELARETPVAVVKVVDAESTEVRDREDADGPGPDPCRDE